ncbi:cytochrome c [Maioricimonas rarisocia]|nr:cytochrome c [Maioricimonas rarisocia]
MLTLLAAIAGGCGGADDKPEASDSAAAPAAAEKAAPKTESEPGAQATASASTKSGKTKWINDIPYDVFYDRPLEVAADGTVVGPTTPPPSPVTPQPEPDMSPGDTPPTTPAGDSGDEGGAGIDWVAVAPVETLAEEMTVLRNRLTANLNTVATYNRNIDQISIDATVLGAIAAVLTVHPEESRWDENAKFIRDLAYDVWISADGTGSKAFRATQEPFEAILTILSGGPPPPGRESDDVVPFGDIVDRGDMMRRIEISFNSLKANVNTADRLAEGTEDAIRELTVLSMFGAMMQTEGYDSADEPNYRRYAGNFVDGSTAARQAVQTQDFDGFSAALNKIQTSCGECHGEYRSGGDGF